MQKNTSGNNGKRPNKKKERKLEKEMKNASERVEDDILFAEKIIEKGCPKRYAEFVAFNRQFIGKRLFYQNKIKWFKDAFDEIQKIIKNFDLCKNKMYKTDDHLFALIKDFEENQARMHTIETATEQLHVFSKFAERSLSIKKEYDDIFQNFVNALCEVKNFVADYDNTYASEMAALKDQATRNYELINIPLLGTIQKILNDLNADTQANIKTTKENITTYEKFHQAQLKKRLDPMFISCVEAVKTKIKNIIEKMTAIRDELTAKKLLEEYDRQAAVNQARILQKNQLDALLTEIETTLSPSSPAAEYKGTTESVFTQHLRAEAEKTKKQSAQLDSAGTEKEKVDIFLQNFSINSAELKEVGEAATNDIAFCFYKARLQYFDGLSTALSSVIDAVDSVADIEHVDQRFTILCREYQEAICNVLIKHNALPNGIVMAKLLLKSAMQDKIKVDSFFQKLISERASRFEGNVRIDAQIFLGSPAYQIAQKNLVLKAAGVLQEIENFCASAGKDTLQQSHPIQHLGYLFTMKNQLAALKAGTPTTNSAEAHNALSESERQRPAALTFDTLASNCSQTFRQDSTLLAFLENLDGRNIKFSELTSFIDALGGTYRVTENNHVRYNLPNIWKSGVTNTTLTLGLPHGHTPDTNENISDPNVRSTIRREFAAAGLTASLITDAMDNLNEEAVLHF